MGADPRKHWQRGKNETGNGKKPIKKCIFKAVSTLATGAQSC